VYGTCSPLDLLCYYNGAVWVSVTTNKAVSASYSNGRVFAMVFDVHLRPLSLSSLPTTQTVDGSDPDDLAFFDVTKLQNFKTQF
jgi:hypothetical protein